MDVDCRATNNRSFRAICCWASAATPACRRCQPTSGCDFESAMLLTNAVSAQEAGRLYEDAAASGASHVKDMAALASKQGDKVPRKRDILRKLSKNRRWPPLCYAQLPLWDMQQQKDVLRAVPLWLPHELLYKLQGKAANESSVCNLDMLEEGELQLLTQCAEKACVAPTSCIGLGIWGDGVPLTRGRAQSAELLTLNILTSAKRGALRLPLAMMQKHLMVKQATWDGVLAIMAWSLQHAAAGTFPCSRHDGAPWSAFLIQVRGDWAFYKQTLYVAAWSLGRIYCVRARRPTRPILCRRQSCVKEACVAS